MDALSLIPYIINGGVALVVFFMIVMGILVPAWVYKDKVAEITELEAALKLERQRSDTSDAIAKATLDVLRALKGGGSGSGDTEK